jgi:hypothetical protein
MTGDYTRFTFDARKRYTGVLMQQGRVQLDSDWNEENTILERRGALQALDTFGPVGVPYLTLPASFLLGLLPGPPPDLSIQPGRLYVDGLLCEAFPEDLSTYLNQPFYPAPPPLPAGDSVAYLDVWQREVTYIEEPGLLDVALGGADTATRLQMVWQLKVDARDGAACGMPVGAPASAGRLSTQAIAPPAPDDPCILPPVAGYRGLENRLYRVEVHESGPLGAARFKWSRDNGSIVSTVTALALSGTQTTLSVNRIGRDQVMRFRIGDWVTVTDDHRELMGEAGEMALVVDIHEDDRQIVLDRPLPTPGKRPFGATAGDLAARHSRIQRWDETASLNPVDADGLIATAPGPMDLEAGIQLLFSADPAGGDFRVGDHWVFWARTATAEIEILTVAPPRGIRHHYVQLAAMTGLGGPAPTIADCRPPPPVVGGGGDQKPGCCTVVVTPGQSIQAAIDSLPPQGGCVCLQAGLHLIDQAIILQRDDVTLHGESLGAVVFNRRGTGLLIVAGTEAARIHTLVFRQGEAAAAPIIMFKGGEDIVIEDCRLEVPERPGSVGVMAAGAVDLVISRCAFQAPALGVWLEEGCRNVSVSGCEFVLAQRVGDTAGAAVLARLMRGWLTVEDTLITGTANGIVINDDMDQPASSAALSRVCHNRIQLLADDAQKARTYGIDVAAPNTMVSGNHIQHRGGPFTAIRLCGDGSQALGNSIISGAKAVGLALAISAGDEVNQKFLPIQRLVVTDNVIEGPQHGIVLLGVARTEVRGNILGRGGDVFGLGIALESSTDCVIADNLLAHAIVGVFAFLGARNSLLDNRCDGGATGLALRSEEAPTLRGNRVTGVDLVGIQIVGATQRCNLIENRLIRCGAKAEIAAGINAADVSGELHLESNEVMDTGLSVGAGGPVAPLAYGIVGQNILEARVEGNLVTYSNLADRSPANEDRALRLRGMLDALANTGNQPVVFGFAIQIANNRFIGPGASALVEIWQQQINDLVFARFERVLFSGNYCAHSVQPPINKDGVTVSLFGRHCSVMGNHVKATTPGFASYDLHGMPGPFIGNASQAGHSGRSAQMPNPESAFNTNPL